MNLHIMWPGWERTLCKEKDWNAWQYENVVTQYNLYLKENRESDFKSMYCSECLEIFEELITLSSEERRRKRNQEWEKEIEEKYIKDEITMDVFEKVKLYRMPRKYERYKWLKTKEKEYKIADLRTHAITTQLYHESTQCYINELYLACILTIGSVIDQFIRQLVDPHYKQREWIPKSNFDEVVKRGFITKKLKKEIKDFKYSIRDPVAHPKAPTFTMLGLPYNKKEEHWGGKDIEPIHTGPEPSAKKGLELFWKLVHYVVYKRQED